MALTLTNADIIQTLEMLSEQILKAEGGTTTTLISNDLASVSDVEGYLIAFLSGNLNGVEVFVDSMDTGTNTATLSTTLSEAVTKTTKFAIFETGYQSFITRSEAIIDDTFRNKGLKLELFLNTAQLKEMHIYKTIELICLSKRKDALDEDIYHSNYLAFRDLFSSELSLLIADYDTNEDGIIQEGEELQALGQIEFVR